MMKTVIKNVCFLLIGVFMSACHSEWEDMVSSPSSYGSRSVPNIQLPKNLIYQLGTKDAAGIYQSTPLIPTEENIWKLVTQMDVTVQAPCNITLTGISARVNGKNIAFAEFQNTSKENHVNLAKGEGIHFCFPMLPAKGELVLRLHTTGNRIIEQSVSGETTGGSICELEFTDFMVTSGNNWMGALDDETYVAQLSLPGTHDAATGDGTCLSLGETQTISLQEQWDMGIRVFDLRPGYKTVCKGFFKFGQELHIYHGIVETRTSWDEAIDLLTTNLTKHPNEFAIVIMRFENDSPAYSKHDVWSSLMSDYLRNELPAEYKVDFRPDLKVKDVRGKLLILSRDSYADTPVTGGYISGWNHDPSGSSNGKIWGKDNQTANLNIQDYFDVSDTNQKWNAIAKLIDWAGNATPTTWTINYTSGNVGVGVNASYYRNAANTNPATYRYIISNDRVDNNVGIIMMDHVGYRTRKNMAQNYTVYGDLLPQAIIDNNFRW